MLLMFTGRWEDVISEVPVTNQSALTDHEHVRTHLRTTLHKVHEENSGTTNVRLRVAERKKYSGGSDSKTKTKNPA